MNHNVKLTLLYTALFAFSTGIWGSTVLSGYLKVISGSNTKVGIAEGIQGFCQILFAFPAGMLAEKFGRSLILKISALFGLLSMLFILYALEAVDFTIMCVGLGLFGCFSGMTNPPMDAIFADSLSDEKRCKMTQWRYSLLLIMSSSGPLTSIFLFFFVGNFWTKSELSSVFFTGVVLLLPSLLIACFFKDSATLSIEEQQQSCILDSSSSSSIERDLSEELLPKKDSTSISSNNNKKSESAIYFVPRIIVASNCVGGFAAGMTVKFFPLFFKEEVLMSPAEVSLIMFLTLLMMSALSHLARALSKTWGKVNVLLVFGIPGAFLLMAIYLMSIGHDISTPGQVPLWRNKILVGCIFIMRTGLINACTPLKQSILMDHVPSEKRALWSAFGSLARFGWSGSAVFGGILMDRYGYGITFAATSLMQLFMSLSLVFLKSFGVS